jgi:hypothetical protein
MKTIIALSMLAFSAANVDMLESESQRDLHSCCEWVCPSDSYSYRSKGMMKGSGSKKSGSGSYGSYYGSGYYRRTEEHDQEEAVDEPNDRELYYGKPVYPPMPPPPSKCYWDCSSCGPAPGPPSWPGHGYQCFPTMTSPSACDCTCCGIIPPEPEPEPCSYRSKAMMMGGSRRLMMGGSGSGYDDDCRRRTAEQGERALPGKGWGGGWGPSIMCECDCDSPSYRSKAMMMGGGSGSM